MELILVHPDQYVCKVLESALEKTGAIRVMQGDFLVDTAHNIVIPLTKSGNIPSKSKQHYPNFQSCKAEWKTLFEKQRGFSEPVQPLPVSSEKYRWVVAVNTKYRKWVDGKWDGSVFADICQLLLEQPDLSPCYMNISTLPQELNAVQSYGENLRSQFKASLASGPYTSPVICDIPTPKLKFDMDSLYVMARDRLNELFQNESDEWKKYHDLLEREVHNYTKCGIEDHICFPIQVMLSLRDHIPTYVLNGPALGSLLLYLLQLQPLDPVKFGLSADLFHSPERVAIPTFEISCPNSKVGEVVQQIIKMFPQNNVIRAWHERSKYDGEILVVTPLKAEVLPFKSMMDDKYNIPAIFAEVKALESAYLHYITIRDSNALNYSDMLVKAKKNSSAMIDPYGFLATRHDEQFRWQNLDDRVTEDERERLSKLLGPSNRGLDQLDSPFLESWVSAIASQCGWSFSKADLLQRAMGKSIHPLVDEIISDCVCKKGKRQFMELVELVLFLRSKHSTLSSAFQKDWAEQLSKEFKRF